LNKTVAHIVGKLHVIAEYHLAGRVQQADVPRCGNQVGLLVVGDDIGQQSLVPLRELDVALRHDEAELLVLLDLVGHEQHRLLAVRRVGTQGGGGLAGG